MQPADDGSETEALEADIERTRAELGDTAEELTAKLDVPRQVRERVEETRGEVAAKAEPLRRNATPIAAGVAVLTALMLIRRRRQRRSSSD